MEIPHGTPERLIFRGLEWEADRVSVSVVYGDEEHQVWFAASEGIGREADFLLPMTLVHAMMTGSRLELPVAVSPRLLSAVPKIQAFFSQWNDEEFQSVPVNVRACEPGAERASGVGCLFSGGVDAFYTLLKHRDEVTHLIYVHGFDVFFEDQTVRTRASARGSRSAREVAKALGKPLIEVETNILHAEALGGLVPADKRGKYMHASHGALLASSALLFQHRFRKVLIAASHDYARLRPWGSHPLLDSLWSTELTDFEHDGLEATRPEKALYISGHELAMEWLRVCHEPPDDAFNCGRCEKCLRTMINLRVAGALERCKTLPNDLDLEAVAEMDLSTWSYRSLAQQNLKALKRLGTEPELTQALAEALRKSQERQETSATRALQTELRKLRTRNQRLAQRNSRLTARYSSRRYKLVDALVESPLRMLKIGKSAWRKGTPND